jgi:hypothetical protein
MRVKYLLNFRYAKKGIVLENDALYKKQIMRSRFRGQVFL